MMKDFIFNIEESWANQLSFEFNKPYFTQLASFVKEAYEQTTVYPPKELIYNAFNHCPFDQVKVVILGQDPYHEPEQAHGLSFSVNHGVKNPPSLKNIYKEIKNDLGVDSVTSGDLTAWADQGVLLLNATLTVEAHKAGAHQKKGWERFTDAAIQQLNLNCEHLVFILWGAFAQKKSNMIDSSKHLILKSAHPSPLSAYRGFWDNHHFSKTNVYLKKNNLKPINW